MNLNANKQEVHLRMDQACALFALDRSINALAQESQALTQFGQKGAAEALAGAADEIAKYKLRYVAECQRSIIIPEAKVVLK